MSHCSRYPSRAMSPGVLYDSPYICIETTFSKREEDPGLMVWVCKHCDLLDQENGIQHHTMTTREEVLLHLHKHQQKMHEEIEETMAYLVKKIQEGAKE